jgi:hypothetical protein
MLRLKSFFKGKLRSVVLGCLLYRNRQRRCRHVIISIKKTVVHKQETFLWIMKKLNSRANRESWSNLGIISVCGSIAIEIPILWPCAVMVGPRPSVLLTPPLVAAHGHMQCLVFHWLIWWPDRGNSWLKWDCLTRLERHTTGYRIHEN